MKHFFLVLITTVCTTMHDFTILDILDILYDKKHEYFRVPCVKYLSNN